MPKDFTVAVEDEKNISRSQPSGLVISQPPMHQYQTDTNTKYRLDNKNT
jgi:hypothetical protein